ncbi:MAG TPA: hypothetical protein VLF60_02265 [Candidatus Saccharimonadales bacterium]|nr:hypothetical protein [Candidatus Saccharimonadales bacterium]
MNRVVGFAGKAETGKSTAAEMLHTIVRPQNGQHLEFSSPILSLAQQWMSISLPGADSRTVIENLRDLITEAHAELVEALVKSGLESDGLQEYLENRTSAPITPETKGAHRQLLEWLGKGAVDHIGPTFWADKLEMKARSSLEEGADLLTIGGVRSGYDAQVVRNLGGSIIRLTRGRKTPILPSEAGLESWSADFDIPNDSTLEDLRYAIFQAWASTIDQAREGS